jgi:hypothetical protein
VSEELSSRSNICHLIHILKRLEGEEDVNIRTVGGFQFEAEGRLARVDDGLALLTGVDVDLPGSAEDIRLSNVTINLCAITSVGQGE